MAEEPVNNKTFKDLIAEQKKTTIAVEKSMMDSEQRAAFEAAENEKFEKRSEAAKRGAETRQANLLKQNSPGSATFKEGETERNTYLRNTFKTFLGKGSSLAKGLSSIGEGLKAKVKGGLENIFKAIKAGAFIAFLGGVVAFLRSDTFKILKDKYLPIIADGLQSLVDTLKSIASGFFVTDPDTGKTTFSAVAGLSNILEMIKDSFLGWVQSLKDGFYDEEGNFSLTAGIKNLAGDFATILASITAFGLLLAPKLFFGTLFQIGKGGGGLAIKALSKTATLFGSIFTSLTGFNTSLADTGTTMSNKVATSKKTGVFRRGLGGITGRFGRLFKLLGKTGLAGLLIGAGVGMATLLKDTKVFTTVGDSFKSLFSVVGDFAKSITNVASKATAKVASVVTGALDTIKNIGKKPITTSSVAPKKSINITKKQLDALRGTGEFALNPKLAAGASQKVATEVIQKSLVKSAFKKIPLISLVAGSGFAIDRALKGEYGKAMLEFASGVAGIFPGPGTAASVAIDAGLLADDLGISVEEAKKMILANGGKVKEAQVRPSETSSDTIDFSTIKNFSAYKKVQGQLRVNPAYDLDNSGAYSRAEFRSARQGALLEGSGSKFAQGPMFLAPTSNVVNNKSTYVMGRPITDTSFGGVISAR